MDSFKRTSRRTIRSDEHNALLEQSIHLHRHYRPEHDVLQLLSRHQRPAGKIITVLFSLVKQCVG